MARHNELRDRGVDLAGKAFTPSHVSDDPLIFVGCALKSAKDKPARTSGSTEQDGVTPPEATEQKGDLLICDLWKNGTNIVHNMRVVNTDTKTHSVRQR